MSLRYVQKEMIRFVILYAVKTYTNSLLFLVTHCCFFQHRLTSLFRKLVCFFVMICVNTQHHISFSPYLFLSSSPLLLFSLFFSRLIHIYINIYVNKDVCSHLIFSLFSLDLYVTGYVYVFFQEPHEILRRRKQKSSRLLLTSYFNILSYKTVSDEL